MGGWFTADTASGDTYACVGGFATTRSGFATLLIEYLRTLPQDEATPRDLTLYEWENAAEAGYELTGVMPDAPPGTEWSTWTARARQHRYGEISYEYVGRGEGDWFYQPDSHPEPDGQRVDGGHIRPTSR